MQKRIQWMVRTALMSGITIVFSQILLPLPFTPVPINLALLAVMVSGALLGPLYGPLSQLIFLLLGAVGLPVFAGFSGGVSVLLGPTGGYLWGYLFCSAIVGLGATLNQSIEGQRKKTIMLLFFLLLGLSACYLFGTLWFSFLTGNEIFVSLGLCVFPFLPGDILKIFCAYQVIKRI